MKFIRKPSAIVFLLLMLAVILLYLLLQTSWVAARLSAWFNHHYPEYHLSFTHIDHSWSKPTELRLIDVTLSTANQSARLDARQIILNPGWQQITKPLHFKSLVLQNGNLHLASHRLDIKSPIQADSLQLDNMSLTTTIDQWQLSGQQINATVVPWPFLSAANTSDKNRFTVSAGVLTLNGIDARQALIEGSIHNNTLVLNNFGAEVSQGTLTGEAARAAEGSWLVNGLRFSNLRMQSSMTLAELWQSLPPLPSVTVKRFDLIDARLEGTGWALHDLDITLQNIRFHQGDWQADNGTLALNATDFVSGKIHLIDPIMNLELSSENILIKQFTTRWEGGLLRASGNFTAKNKHLRLDDVAIAALEYTLPTQWKQFWQEPLPSWLSEISVIKLAAHNNLLIDINPDFPFQVTALSGYANNLSLARKHQWNLWSGTLTLNASNATFNKSDLRRPAITVTADDEQVTVTDFSALSKMGLLEGSATASQHNHQFSLQLNGRAVDINSLHNWGWPLLPGQGNGNLVLQLSGSLSGPLKPSLNGELQVTDTNRQGIHQVIRQGEFTTLDTQLKTD